MLEPLSETINTMSDASSMVSAMHSESSDREAGFSAVAEGMMFSTPRLGSEEFALCSASFDKETCRL